MVNSVFRRFLVVGLVISYVTFFVALFFACDKKTSSSASENYRLMCWLPGGEPFYNGTASSVDPQGWGLTFVPNIGPQAGMTISTTNACTWAKL